MNDDNSINELNCNVPTWKTEGVNKRAVWDWIKYNIRVHAMSYSKNIAKQRKVEEIHLQNDYDKLTKMFESDRSNLNKIRLNDIKKTGIILGGKGQKNHHSRKSSFVRTLSKKLTVLLEFKEEKSSKETHKETYSQQFPNNRPMHHSSRIKALLKRCRKR